MGSPLAGSRLGHRFVRINADLTEAHHASVTVGIAQLEAGDSVKGLIARSEEAMYRERQQRPSLCG